MRYLVQWMIVLLAAMAAAGPAAAQQVEVPPAALWRIEANGDTVQTSLGLVLPRRWATFERSGFTSTRADGASVAVHYRQIDGPLKLRVLVQQRADVRGVILPGADGLDRNWNLIQTFGASEYFDRAQGTPEDLAGGRLVWGDARAPNARLQLRRYSLPAGHEIQGLWYRNIGVWAVAVSVSGPESRRADIETAGRSAMTEIKWPGAPLSAELQATESTFLNDLRDCDSKLDRSGTGKIVDPGIGISSMIGIALKAYFVEGLDLVPHPAIAPARYCRVETFKVGRYEVVALAWTGSPSAYPAARYAFLLKGHAVLLQFESFFTVDSLPPAERRGISRLVWLTSSGSGSVALERVLTDWPSYDEAKAIVVSIGNEHHQPLVTLSHPPGQILATVNYRPPAEAAPLPATPGK